MKKEKMSTKIMKEKIKDIKMTLTQKGLTIEEVEEMYKNGKIRSYEYINPSPTIKYKFEIKNGTPYLNDYYICKIEFVFVERGINIQYLTTDKFPEVGVMSTFINTDIDKFLGIYNLTLNDFYPLSLVDSVLFETNTDKVYKKVYKNQKI